MGSSSSTTSSPSKVTSINAGARSSSLSLDLTPCPPSSVDGNGKTVKIGFFEIPLFWANFFFAFVTVVAMVGQNVSLPLWIDSTNGNSPGDTVDSYFVLIFTNLSFAVIFGLWTLYIRIFSPRDLGEMETNFSHKLLFSVGFFDSLNDAMISFASKGSRTPPYLQNILGNFMIPVTILFRIVVVRKKPTCRKLCCGIVVIGGLFISLVPTIFSRVDPKVEQKDLGEGDGISRVMWPIMFMLAFVPAALMNVLEERGLKMENETSGNKVNMVYFLFWTSTYQFICIVFLIWVNILPWYGNVTNMQECVGNMWFGLQCFFGAAGCDTSSVSRGTTYIFMHLVNHFAGACLLRYAEGATWLAIVSSLVTPLGFLFWTLFSEIPFKWQPEGDVDTWFSIGALAIMVPAIFVYNMGAPEISLNSDESEGKEFDFSHRIRYYHSLPGSARPLLSDFNQLQNYSV